MRVADVVLDNPILVKHARSRLRRGQVVPWAVVVLVLSACIAWAGYEGVWFDATSAVMMLLGLQIVLLSINGMIQVGASLGGARISGILDFHRVSPLPSSAVALGFFLGSPIREYVLAGISVPFALLTAGLIDPSDTWRGVAWTVQLEVAILVTSWVGHALAMVGSLTGTKKRGQASLSTLAATFLALIAGSYGSFGFYYGGRWLLAEPRGINFFGVLVPWLAWLLIYELPALGFLLLAASRKIRSERMHAYSKPEALACMMSLALLTVGGLWNVGRLIPYEPMLADIIMLASVYVLTLGATILAVTITPDAGSYVKGVRRALRQGGRRPGVWSDAGSNRPALFALAALVLVGATVVVNIVGRPPLPAAGSPWSGMPQYVEEAKLNDAQWLSERRAHLSRPIALAVLTVAYFGLALQYFSLRTRASGQVLISVFVFMAWLVPMLAGAALGISTPAARELALAILALSPLPGIALSADLGRLPNVGTLQLAAIAPAITFAFLFNYLLVLVQRKIDRLLHTQGRIPAWEADPDGDAAGRPPAAPVARKSWEPSPLE